MSTRQRSKKVFMQSKVNVRNTVAELQAWDRGDREWGFHVRTPTKQLLRLFRLARYCAIEHDYHETLW